MKKQMLALFIFFSTASYGSALQKQSTHNQESENLLSLLLEQNELLKKIITQAEQKKKQAEHDKKQAEQEQTRKRKIALQANQPWITIPAILSLSQPKLNLTYPAHKNFEFENQTNIFYDQYLDPQAVAVLIFVEKTIIENGYAYLWPTIRSIIVNRIASKITNTSFEAVDSVTDATFGLRPWEIFSSLTPEDKEKNKLLRTPEIAQLVTELKNLQKECLTEDLKEKLLRQIAELKKMKQEQNSHRTARADSVIAVLSNPRKHEVEEVD